MAKTVSSLTHKSYYDSQVQLDAEEDVAVHYESHGWQRGINPHPLFDTEYYLRENPEVASAGISPLRSYLEMGAACDTNPHPFFDSSYYRQCLSDAGVVIPEGKNILLFFLETWFGNRIDPHPLFDGNYYLARNPDIATMGENPLVHFAWKGVWEGRSPHPDYPERFLLADSRVHSRRLNPFLYWLEERNQSDSDTALRQFLKWRYDRAIPHWMLQDARLLEQELEDSGLEELAGQIVSLTARTPKSTPQVSVILPLHNQIQHTLCCLYSLMRSTAGQSVEVILADDCSNDSSAHILPQIAVNNIRYCRTSRQLGFAGNCMFAAEYARGEFLVFLNNDTLVLPEWLEELVAPFSEGLAHNRIGMSCSMLIYPDGRLQEAGGKLYREGTAANFGWGADPSAPQFNYARDVDYGSGASLAIRRELWEELGGFDRRFSPAYYEDTDIAMQVRDKGYRVRYVPHSVALHFEGVSHGDDLNSGTKRFQRRNRDRFFSKWRRELSIYPPKPRRVDRDASHRAKITVLIVDACTPTPDQDSGSVDTVEYMKALLALGYRVIFVPQNGLHFGSYTRDLQRLGIECVYGPGLTTIRDAIAAYAELIDVALLFRYYVASEAVPLLRKMAPRARLVFETVDLHHLREIREAKLTGSEADLSAALEVKDTEFQLMRDCDATVVVSQHEQDYLGQELPDARVCLLPFGREEPRSDIVPAIDRKDILFIGGFRHTPNIDAVIWFHDEVWPLLLEAGFQENLLVVGAEMPSEIRALASPQVHILGHVPDISRLYSKVRLSIAPLRFGAGIKGKIVTSLSYGVPCVTTSVGTEGAAFKHGENILVADSALAFGEAIMTLQRDPALWERLSAEGKRLFLDDFSVDAFRKKLGAFMNSLEPSTETTIKPALYPGNPNSGLRKLPENFV